MLKKLLKKSIVEFCLVHAHRLDTGFTGAILKDEYYMPLIITCHGSDIYDFPFRDDFRYTIAIYTPSKVNHVITVRRSDAEKLLSLGLPSNKLSIIPNGFDDNLFQPIPEQSTREKLGLPLNKKILLSVGTLHEVKGYEYLIDAMYMISRVRNDIIAVIVGSGPLETKLREKIKKLSLKQRVILVGWEPHNKIPLWMNASDIFVLPSLNEGFPTVIPEATFLIAGSNPPLSLVRKIEKTRNVRYLGYVENLEGWIKSSKVCIVPILRGGGTNLKILEYAAAGKPIVATHKAVEGLEMVNNVHGPFYKYVNEGFVSGIRRLLKCDELAEELGRNAKQLAKKYDWRAIGKKLYETYLDLMSYVV